MNKTKPCLLLFLSACLSPADAAIFAREDFNYLNGGLSGNNGGVGWSAGWFNTQGTASVAGGKGTVNAVSGQQASRLISGRQTPPAGGTKIVWISFEGQQSTNVSGSTSTESYGGLGLYDGNTERLLIGKSWPGDYQWKAGTNTGLVGPAVPVSTLSMTKIVARITMADPGTDTLDVWINPADTSSVAALGAPQITRTDTNLSFDTLRIRAGKGSASITAESWAFDAVTAGDTLADVVASDSDGDGMLDAWELAHGLVVGVNDAALDPDSDGSPNLQEYQRSTDPNNPDSDSDTIPDGAETGTGIYVNASNTGTNPLMADSDGDVLTDGEETNSGIFVDEFNPGTNPNLVDTDGDGTNDFTEILRGYDPTDASPAQTPPSGDLATVGTDDFDDYTDGPAAGLNGGSGFDYENSTAFDAFVGHTTLGFSNWGDVFGTSTISGGKLLTQNSGAKREFNGPLEGNSPDSSEYLGAINREATTYGRVVYLRADMKRGDATTWNGISAYDFGTERVFAGVPDAVNPVSGVREFAIGTPAPTPVYTGIPVQAGRDYTLVLKVDFQNNLVSFWVNPNLNAPEATPAVTTPFTLDQWVTAARIGSGGTDPTSWDHFVVAREWSALSVFPGVVPAGDNYLSWIGGYNVSGQTGFGQDPDGDGLSNGIEHVLGSDPTIAGHGLRLVSSSGSNSFVFRHTRTNALGTDVTPSYEWSADLAGWHASGLTDTAGNTATISHAVINDTTAPAVDEIEVTVTLTGGTAKKVFVRLKASK